MPLRRSVFSSYFYHHVVVISLLVLFATLSHGLSLNSTVATYDIQESHFLGKTFEHAVFEADFNEEVYVMRQWACSCHGGVGDPPCPIALNSPVALPANETGYSFIELQEGEWTSAVVNTEYGQSHYKFQLNPNPSVPCPMIHIDKESETGTMSAFISVGEIPSAAHRMWYSAFFGYSTISICPMHPNFTYGTFYITLVNQRSSSMNSFRLRYRVQNSPTCLASYTPPFALPVNHTAWLQDGIAHHSGLDYPNLDYYSFQSRARCTNLSVSLNRVDAGDLDLYISTQNPYPNYEDHASHQWHSTVDGDDRVNIAYCDPNPSATSTVFYIGVRAAAVGYAEYNLVATVQQWAEPYPISALAYGQSRFELSFGAAPFINCSHGQVFTCGFPTYSLCYNDGFDCCYRFTPIAPTQVLQALWPWSEAGDVSIGDASWTIPWRDVEPLTPGKLAWSLILSESTPDRRAQFVHGDIGTCTIEISNALVDAHYKPLVSVGSAAAISFNPKAFACDNEALDTAIAQVDALSASLLNTSLDTFADLGLQDLRLAIAAISPAIRGCEGFVDALVEHVTKAQEYGETRLCYELPGSSAWSADPCCNFALRQCCNPHPFLVQRSVPVAPLTSTIDSTCKTPECSKASVKTWIDSVNRASDLDSGCERIVNQVASLDTSAQNAKFIDECRVSIMGEDLMGSACLVDSDCLSGSTCQPLTLRCNHTDDQVVDCLVREMPVEVSRILYNEWGLTSAVTPTVLAQQLKARVFSNQCVGPTARAYINGYHWIPQVGGCTDQCSADGADPYCFDRSCPVPPYCDGATGTGACYRYYGPTVNDTVGCLADQSCNWKRCILGEPDYDSCMSSCESGSADVCVDCSSGFCREVTSITNATRCGQGLCSTNPSETSQSACEASGICSQSCPTCNTMAGCMAVGSCDDVTLVPQGAGRGGVCYEPAVVSSSGSSWVCSNTATTMTVLGCAYTNLTQVECQAISGTTWRPYATNSAQCTSPVGCYDENNQTIPLPQSQCVACSGYTWKSHFTYTPSATWTPGRMQALSWRARAIVQTNTVKRTLSYTTLMDLVNEAITSQYAYAYRTQALCRYDAPLRLVHSATCDCNTGSYDPDGGACFGSISDSQVGSGLGCSSLSSEIQTPVASLSIQENSFPPSPCSNIGLYFTAASQYELSTTFNQAVFRASAVNSFWIVKNQYDANVGQIISGAVRVELATTLVEPAVLCIDIDRSLGVASSAVTFAFAYLDSDNEIHAFPATNPAFTNQLGQVCAGITESGTYFATKLVSGYDTKKLRTGSETAQYRIAAVLFGLTALFGIVQGILLLMNAGHEKILVKKLVFIVIIIINCIIRAVFVSLPANAFKPSAAAGQFTIFELPSFLFFTVFTAIIYLWIIVIAKTGVLGNRRAMKQRRRTIFRIYVIGNIFMYLVFIVFIILIAVLPKLQKKSPCFLGTASEEAAGSNVAYDIKLAYWIFQFIVSVVVALAFLLAAVLLLRLMTKSQVRLRKKRTAKNQTSLIIITSVAVVCSIVILIRSSVFLWSAATGNTVNVLVFAFLEIIPQAFLLFYLHPFRIFREADTTSMNSNTDSNFTSETAQRSGNSRSSKHSRGPSIRSMHDSDPGVEMEPTPRKIASKEDADADAVSSPTQPKRKRRPKAISDGAAADPHAETNGDANGTANGEAANGERRRKRRPKRTSAPLADDVV